MSFLAKSPELSAGRTPIKSARRRRAASDDEDADVDLGGEGCDSESTASRRKKSGKTSFNSGRGMEDDEQMQQLMEMTNGYSVPKSFSHFAGISSTCGEWRKQAKCLLCLLLSSQITVCFRIASSN